MKYTISKAKTFTDKEGQEKTSWSTVGFVNILENSNSKVKGYLNIPLLGEFPLFENVEREDNSKIMPEKTETHETYGLKTEPSIPF